ncbi:MAG: PulJ/GspJ family protein [Rubrobacteraceae bacterium]
MKLVKIFRREDGFTLIEALVAMLVMVTVMFALYAIFDAGVRIFRFGNDKAEAVESARVGMERELRAAYPYSRTDGGAVLFPAFGPNSSGSISFGNDLNGNGAIGAASSGERIEYRLVDESPPTLYRLGNPLAMSASPGGLVFTYLDENGNLAAEEKDVSVVRIELAIDVEGRAQTLTTDVALRNRAD